MPKPKEKIIIYTDGACLGNPGPGGYGVVILDNNHRKELSGGFRKTTNNRMELMAAIKGLKAIKPGREIKIYSDSYYMVRGINNGYARRWKANGWMRTKKEKALNADLWDQLLQLCKVNCVEFKWVRGHAGVKENERCDFLSTRAARKKNLPADVDYENENKISALPLFKNQNGKK